MAIPDKSWQPPFVTIETTWVFLDYRASWTAHFDQPSSNFSNFFKGWVNLWSNYTGNMLLWPAGILLNWQGEAITARQNSIALLETSWFKVLTFIFWSDFGLDLNVDEYVLQVVIPLELAEEALVFMANNLTTKYILILSTQVCNELF